MMANDVVVVVGSCDRYNFTWPLFCHGLKKYWRDRPWPIYIITNHLDAPCAQTIKVGTDQGWTEGMRIALRIIDKPVMLLTCDDAWLTAPPDTQALSDWADIILRGEADYIRLSTTLGEPGRDNTYPGNSRLYIVPDRYKYRASLMPALWSVETFLSLTRDGEGIWLFECRGSERAWSDNERFLCAKDTVAFPWPHRSDPEWYHMSTPIAHRQWCVTSLQYAMREGLIIDWASNPYGWLRGVKLNLGCGEVQPYDYINIDTKPQFNPDVVGDPYDLSLIADGIIEEIKLDEYVYRLEALREWRRVLEPGGKLVINWNDVFIAQKVEEELAVAGFCRITVHNLCVEAYKDEPFA